MSRPSVLFVCIHNSARSQMAEAYLKQLAGDRFDVESAGIEPGELNPLAVQVMKEEDIDISGNAAKGVLDFLKQGKHFDCVITVCDETAAGRCPVFPGAGRRLHWSLPDPSAFLGSWEEKIAKTRTVRNQIRRRIEDFISIQS
jgi:arsenate reductase